MNLKPKISVIMSVYNGEQTVSLAIESILKQTFKNFEFIIINDGSTDLTKKILNRFNDERITIINQENIGLTKSLNKAIKLCRSSLIARQDADEVSYKSRLETQYNYFLSDSSLALLGSQAFIIDGKIRENTKKIIKENLIYKLKRNNIFIHGTVMFRKKFFLEIGMYNESYKYSQDYDAWLRLVVDHKKKAFVSDEIVLKRNIVKNSISKNKFILQSINGFKIRSNYVNIFENTVITLRHLLISFLPVTMIFYIKKFIFNKN
tara:strand:- start:225 stop:1013 length:789 start_codon:yes stop_codon:yes gene_type:complete